MELEWLIKHERELEELISERKQREQDAFERMRAAVLTEKFKRHTVDSVWGLMQRVEYRNRDWGVTEKTAHYKGVKIFDEARIRELWNLAEAVYSDKERVR